MTKPQACPKSRPMNRAFSIAPMMDWTDRHCRAFHRTLSREALLYTEMVTSAAIKHGRRAELLDFSACEQPVALQLGGSDPVELALAAKIGEEWGYREINLNVGCPSDRVQSGQFGACLMATPQLVADCVNAMGAAVNIPVTVKCRIGIDAQSEDEPLDHFIQTVKRAGCTTFIIHARKAWLSGLSPKENREIPPLNYPRVHRLKRENPELEIILNGGLETLQQAELHMPHVDGVMLGRAAYHTPFLLAEVDAKFYGKPQSVTTRMQALEAFIPYVETELARGTQLARITRHMLGLWHGEYGGRTFRRILSEEAHKPGAGLDVLLRAAQATLRQAAA